MTGGDIADAVAHVRERDNRIQTVHEHLYGAARFSARSARKIDLEQVGELLGLAHDLGKLSAEFQAYIQAATGLIDADEDGGGKDLRGKVDHSTAGAQFVWQELSKKGQLGEAVGQVLALCIASHHSGLIDCLGAKETSPLDDIFSRRMRKTEDKVHFEEVREAARGELLERLEHLVQDDRLPQVGNVILVPREGDGLGFQETRQCVSAAPLA